VSPFLRGKKGKGKSRLTLSFRGKTEEKSAVQKGRGRLKKKVSRRRNNITIPLLKQREGGGPSSHAPIIPGKKKISFGKGKPQEHFHSFKEGGKGEKKKALF